MSTKSFSTYGSSFKRPARYIRFFLFVESSSPSVESSSKVEHNEVSKDILPLPSRQTTELELLVIFSNRDLFLKDKWQG
jgi:hypothetical protein